ncbi:Tudor domain-containing protein 1 [Pseudolycoriella hygida]|uniref:Tudor domain-containing protein 1 n=1 Tax=Pseudolycoriella hygida TaxID=35572 RepID=A0A9Q0MUK6_9DIPT|nr:Tudor domain-containing protein 1 [Pseudolycoriella hygida]
MSMEGNHFCRFCHSKAELVCHRCRDPYCSRVCQESDWFDHKLICFPIPVEVMKILRTKGYFRAMLSSLVKAVDIRNIPVKLDQRLGIQPKIATNVPVPPARPDIANHKLSPESDLRSKSPAVNEGKVSPPAHNPSVDRSDKIEKPMEKKVFKQSDCKWDKVDVNSIRKPGILSQVMRNSEPPKPTMIEQQPKSVAVEPPKPAMTVQQPKSITVEPTKPTITSQQPQSITEPPKQATIAQQPKSVAVESPKQIPAEKTDEQPKKVDAVPIPKEIESKSGLWMKPSPIGENEFVHVIVQYIAADNTPWVSLIKDEGANNDLLRIINKNISFTSAPDPAEVTKNSLFFVPFEGIYYRGTILDDVCPEGTVTVRLIDYGNDFKLSIGELRTPLPAVCDQHAYAFPIIFQKSRNIEVGAEMKIKKESMKGDVMVVVGEDENTICTIKDIEIVPIPVGSNTKLFGLDFSNIGQGYVSASIPDEAALKRVDDMTEKITDYCTGCKDAYSPQVDEICFAEFEDGQWYRALVQKVTSNDEYEILFIDYGNVTTAKSSSLRKMSDDFLHPCMMNFCYIKG